MSADAFGITGNWAELDSLGGVPLRDAERILVFWPNGEQSSHAVAIRSSMREVQDMSHVEKCPNDEAFIEVYINGAFVMVATRNLPKAVLASRLG